MMSEWIPKSERSKMITFIWSGSSIGTSLSHFLSGYLSEIFSWELTFYLFGFVAIVFAFGWNHICFDSPYTHPNIQEEELKLIVSDLPPKRNDQTTRYIKKKSPPIFQMLRSVPVLALIFTTFGFGWAYFTLLNQAPIYLHTVIHICPTTVIKI
jgi:MFS family permease